MEKQNNHQGSYLRFFTMIGVSMVVMFLLMYANTYQLPEHVRFSETRLFMTLIMGAAMAIIMLFFMRGMYKNKQANAAIYIGASLMLILSIWLVRSQTTVTDSDYMEAMIPHHSIAILTSERAQIEDLRVQALSIEIIDAQRREIGEMEWLIDDIQANGVARTQEEADARPVPDFSGAPD